MTFALAKYVFDASEEGGLAGPMSDLVNRTGLAAPPYVDAIYFTTDLEPASFSNDLTPDGSFEAVVTIAAGPFTLTTPALVPVPDPLMSGPADPSKRAVAAAEDRTPSKDRINAGSSQRPIPSAPRLKKSSENPVKENLPERESPETVAAPINCLAPQNLSFVSPYEGGPFPVRSSFGYRTSPKHKFHKGTDYVMPENTPIRAAESGKVVKIGVDSNDVFFKTGYGLYMVVEHAGGTQSYYGHLNLPLVTEGQTVNRGAVIAESGATGDVTGPHLHFAILAGVSASGNQKSFVDPEPCVDQSQAASITVRDRGPDFDDVFAVSINGVQVCVTDPGGSNTCGIESNLLPSHSTVTLTITCLLDGTQGGGGYEIVLANGLTFDDGSTTMDGVISEGSSASFAVLVP